MTDRAKTTDAPGAPGGDGVQRSPGQPAAPAGAAPDEFAHIRTPRTRHPLVLAGAALLAFFLIFHSRHELRYALSPTAALDLGDARITFKPSVRVDGIENRYVRVRGTPDRESALELDTKGSWVFTQLFRVLGTGDRLFVHRPENPLPAFRAEEDAFEGRLVRFGDLSFVESIRAYFSAHVTATHVFPADELRRALAATPAGPTTTLRDRAGDQVSLAAGDTLAIDVARPDEIRLGLPRERFATEADARAAITAQGGEVLSFAGNVRAAPPASAPAAGPLSLASSASAPVERWVFVARFPAARRDAALSALGELDRRVEIRDARETVKVRLSELSAAPAGADGDALVVRAAAGERRLPLAAIASVRTLATVQIPADAYLLIEADHPRDHLPTLFIVLVLAMFGVVNVMGLVRELRR